METLMDNMEYGDKNNDNNVYVELAHAKPYNSEKVNTLVLKMVHVSQDKRNQGIFSNILNILEKRADRDEQNLFVGPLVTDDSQYIEKVCTKRGYKPQMPFGLIRKQTVNKVHSSPTLLGEN